MPRVFVSLFATLSLLLAGVAVAQSRVVPTDPIQFERVHLRQTVDNCRFASESVSVSLADNVVTVLQPLRACLLPGEPRVVDIQLGAFPPGEYDVQVVNAVDAPVAERIAFTVSGLATIAIAPEPPLPLADYGGVWWTPTESGWGLSLHHGRAHALSGALFVYGADGEPQWYLLTEGQWTSATRWSGELFRFAGTPWSQPWDAAQAQGERVGEASLEFEMLPGAEDEATLDYRIGDTSVSQRIERMRL